MKLSTDEIDEANARLVERHPLCYANMKIWDIFPFLKWLRTTKLGEKDEEEPNALDSFLESDEERSDGIRQGKTEHERYNRVRSQKAKAKKGFLTLGYGFIAYFDFMEFMIVLFTALTLLAIPSMYYYVNYRDIGEDNVPWINMLQMGNLGYSSALCRDVHLGVGKLTLS